MHRNLTLLPFDSEYEEMGYTWSHTRLQVTTHRDVLDALDRLPSEPVGLDFWSSMAPGGCGTCTTFGPTPTITTGVQLRWVLAEYIAALGQHPDVLYDWRNRAIWAYISALHPRTRIALWWDDDPHE